MKSSFLSNPITIEGNALFLSDAHFGAPSKKESFLREELLIQLLTEQKEHLDHLFLLGDIFDFWFEYEDVVPKGYFRLFNMFYELNQKGVKIYFFTGNHDMWLTSYFKQQFDCQVFYEQHAFVINGKHFLVGHGDGIGGKQRRYRFIKQVFAFKPNRVLYSMLHPRWAFAIAQFFSNSSRKSHKAEDLVFKEEREFQVQFARQVLLCEPVDFFVYGHRHIPMEYRLTEQSLFFNTGDWMNHYSYVAFNQQDSTPSVCYFKKI